MPIYRCSVSTWVSGKRSALALDGAGNLRIGYEAEHGISGTSLDRPWLQCPTVTDIQLVRYLLASHPWYFWITDIVTARRS